MNPGDCRPKMAQRGACALGTRGYITDHVALVLGRRLMAVAGYEPAHGTISTDGLTAGLVASSHVWTDDGTVHLAEFVPDVREPATIGALTDQIAEALGDGGIHLRPTASGWAVFTGAGELLSPRATGPSKGAALVGAAEVADG